jgi:UDP-N-acetylmuramoyl-L-alanyl-D-glutamate--2,6-diaminopimelate ligase
MRVFISGILGTGARYLAEYFLNLGYQVAGSDLKENEISKKLCDLGAEVYTIRSPSYFNDVDIYIYSAALPENHAELKYFTKHATQVYEVGNFINQLYKQISAVQKTDLFPLAGLDWSAKKYFAVTGTDGKTTTASMIAHILRKQGHNTALISTLGVQTDKVVLQTGLHTTTPSAHQLAEILQSEELSGVTHVVIEVTSHALAMGRIAGAKFAVAVITNITSDHLDYHKSWDNYFAAKASLLTDHLMSDGVAILNAHDSASDSLHLIAEKAGINCISNAKFPIEKVELNPELDTDYNRQNASLALLATQGQLNSLQDFLSLRGRLNVLQTLPFKVIVDFAHTANALHQLLAYVRKETVGKVKVVFGCAGMRDRAKRPEMGRIAAQFADQIFLVPEDPRLEKVSEINDEIVSGLSHNIKVQRFDGENVADRIRGIEAAIKSAHSGDTVLICGKGHELSMCFGTEEYPYDEIAVVRRIIKQA